jgi:penicillin-binding protein 1C
LLPTAAAAVLIGGAALWWAAAPAALPDFAEVRDAYTPTEAYLLDRHGEVVQVQREDYSRRRLPWVPLTQVSPALVQAIVQAEDRRFTQHAGVDLRALAGAGAQDAAGRHRGASTITMQLVAQLDPALAPRRGRRSLLQKLRQVRSAWRLEAAWSKPQILEAYLNLVGFRGELQGVNTAARALFGKTPAGLTQDESWRTAPAALSAAWKQVPTAPGSDRWPCRHSMAGSRSSRRRISPHNWRAACWRGPGNAAPAPWTPAPSA